MSLGGRIRETRKEKKIDVAEIARAAGVTKQAVYQWESGDTKSLKGDNLLAVAAVLGVSAKWLTTGKGAQATAAEEQVAYVTADATEVAKAYMKLSPALRDSVRTMVFSMASAQSVARWLVIEPPKGDGYAAWERAIQDAYEADTRQRKLNL